MSPYTGVVVITMGAGAVVVGQVVMVVGGVDLIGCCEVGEPVGQWSWWFE
jgi:hypothetical protein